jgi:hypothetical protein
VSEGLSAFVRRELAQPVPAEIRDFARQLAQSHGVVAVLFYGSNLRTGELDGVLDFYLLTGRPHRRGLRALVERSLWPEVGYHERQVKNRTLRAKVATMPLATFRRAAEGATLDTTIWARFVQPSALIWSADRSVAAEVEAAIAAAAVTAGRFAAALGPAQGAALEFWKALFRRTYAAEFRVESAGRVDQVLAFDPARYETLLPLAWAAGGISWTGEGVLEPQVSTSDRGRQTKAWSARQRAGKPLNVARLLKAAFTFDGAARYAAWKIERHTGVPVPVTPWRERHPILAAPGVLWRLWRARRGQAEAR